MGGKGCYWGELQPIYVFSFLCIKCQIFKGGAVLKYLFIFLDKVLYLIPILMVMFYEPFSDFEKATLIFLILVVSVLSDIKNIVKDNLEN